MAPIDEQSATITIPAAYLEDARAAIIAEIRDTSDELRGDSPLDRECSARILRRDMALMDQLLDATGDTTLNAEQDSTSSPLVEMLEEMVRLLAGRLERVSVYAPLPMRDVLDITERLAWAAREAVRICPSIDDRLTGSEAVA